MWTKIISNIKKAGWTEEDIAEHIRSKTTYHNYNRSTVNKLQHDGPEPPWSVGDTLIRLEQGEWVMVLH